MKQSFCVFIIMITVFVFSACGNVETESGNEQTKESDNAGKILVAYFSWADNALQDDIDAMTSPSVKIPGDVA